MVRKDYVDDAIGYQIFCSANIINGIGKTMCSLDSGIYSTNHCTAVATTTVDRLYTTIYSNTCSDTQTLSFIGGTGDTLATSYLGSGTGDQSDLTGSRTLVPGDNFYWKFSVDTCSSGAVVYANACVRMKVSAN